MGKPEDKSPTEKKSSPDGTIQASLYFNHTKNGSLERAGKRLPPTVEIRGRRAYVNQRYYEEAAIKKLIEIIEHMGADVRLSQAQLHLDRAFDCMADYFDGLFPLEKYVTISTVNKALTPDLTPKEDVHDPVCYLIEAAWSNSDRPIYLGFKHLFPTQISWVTPSDEEFAMEFATPLSAELFLAYSKGWDAKNRDTLFPMVVPTPKIVPFYDHVGPLKRPEKKDQF